MSQTKKLQPKRRLQIRTTVREVHFCSQQTIFLVVGYGVVQIYDINLENPIQSVRIETSVRTAGLSDCGRYFFVMDVNNKLLMFDTRTATILQKINQIPTSTKCIKFSQNYSRMIYGNSQMICLWSIRGNRSLMRTQHWKNINCYDLHKNGKQFAIGTYNGSVYLLDFIEPGKCNQIEIKKHKTCVMSLCFHKNQLISLAYDGIMVQATVQNSRQGKVLKYTEVTLPNSPKRVESVGETFYIFDRSGMAWFNKYQSLVGFTDFKAYYVMMNQDNQLIFIKQGLGQLEWWPGSAFKSKQEITKDQQKENRRIYIIERKKE